MSSLPVPSSSSSVASPNKGVRIPLPNGRMGTFEDLIDHDYRPGSHTSMFADPTKYMKEVNSDCQYGWVAFRGDSNQAHLLGKVRSGAYRLVDSEEVLDDKDIPIMTHRLNGQDCVAIYDLILVEIQPQAVKRYYRHREQQALLKTVNNVAFGAFQQQVENASGGMVRASFEVKDVD